MPTNMPRRLAVLVAAMMALISLATAGQAEAAMSASALSLQSSTPKIVVLDATSGNILSVSTGTSASPLISNDNICYPGDGCYYSGQVPWAHQGFYGSPGTYYGSWPYRSGWHTGRYYASACWVSLCRGPYGPNTTVLFNYLVTGTSFTIHY